MPTSQERFEEEIRELALLVQHEEPRAEPPRRTPPRRRHVFPAGFVQAWAWWRRPGPGAARP